MLKPPSLEAVEVIRQCRFEAGRLFLVEERLAKPLYAEVKRVLEAMGGFWNTSAQAFLFDYDYQERLLAVLDGRENLPERNPTAYFPTPAGLAASVVKQSLGIIGLRPGARVLEPSAGRAALIDAVRDVRSDLVFEACEIDPFHREYLAKRGVTLVGEDLLSFSTETKYDAVVMNPPFSLAGDKSAWLTHVEKAMSLLASGGTLIAILPDAAVWRDTAQYKSFRARVLAAGGSFQGNSKDAFKESGTMTATCTLFIGGVDNEETRAAAAKNSLLDAEDAGWKKINARIAAVVPLADHADEVQGLEKAFGGKRFILPEATRFSEIFEIWEKWTEAKCHGSRRENCVYISSSDSGELEIPGMYGDIRPEVLARITDRMLSGFGLHFELIPDEESGFTKIFARYDQIIGSRLVALVETRSVACSAIDADDLATAVTNGEQLSLEIAASAPVCRAA